MLPGGPSQLEHDIARDAATLLRPGTIVGEYAVGGNDAGVFAILPVWSGPYTRNDARGKPFRGFVIDPDAGSFLSSEAVTGYRETSGGVESLQFAFALNPTEAHGLCRIFGAPALGFCFRGSSDMGNVGSLLLPGQRLYGGILARGDHGTIAYAQIVHGRRMVPASTLEKVDAMLALRHERLSAASD